MRLSLTVCCLLLLAALCGCRLVAPPPAAPPDLPPAAPPPAPVTNISVALASGEVLWTATRTDTVWQVRHGDTALGTVTSAHGTWTLRDPAGTTRGTITRKDSTLKLTRTKGAEVRLEARSDGYRLKSGGATVLKIKARENGFKVETEAGVPISRGRVENGALVLSGGTATPYRITGTTSTLAGLFCTDHLDILEMIGFIATES